MSQKVIWNVQSVALGAESEVLLAEGYEPFGSVESNGFVYIQLKKIEPVSEGEEEFVN